ncbi:hypothetical protein TPA0907_36860 [Micromonospora humidisoli]|nr:hypothetical protein TPA0907_36860 [Micromonospora sp. AKA109]
MRTSVGPPGREGNRLSCLPVPADPVATHADREPPQGAVIPTTGCDTTSLNRLSRTLDRPPVTVKRDPATHPRLTGTGQGYPVTIVARKEKPGWSASATP